MFRSVKKRKGSHRRRRTEASDDEEESKKSITTKEVPDAADAETDPPNSTPHSNSDRPCRDNDTNRENDDDDDDTTAARVLAAKRKRQSSKKNTRSASSHSTLGSRTIVTSVKPRGGSGGMGYGGGNDTISNYTNDDVGIRNDGTEESQPPQSRQSSQNNFAATTKTTVAPAYSDHEDQGNHSTDNNDGGSGGGGGGYDTQELLRLRAEQASYQVKPTPPDAPALPKSDTDAIRDDAAAAAAVWNAPSAWTVAEPPPPSAEDYISLVPGSRLAETTTVAREDDDYGMTTTTDHHTILTGDEALRLSRQQGQRYDDDEEDDGDDMSEVDDDTGEQDATTEAWQAQILRRAGPPPASTATTFPSQGTASTPSLFETLHDDSAGSSRIAATATPFSRLDEIRTQMTHALTDVQRHEEDLASRVRRRQVDVVTETDTWDRQEAHRRSAESAVAFYQRLQTNLCAWVGAMRELEDKVNPILSALHELEGDLSGRHDWLHWENDAGMLLQQHGILSHVLGRKLPPPPFTTDRGAAGDYESGNNAGSTAVDEFGRSIKSQAEMKLEQRRNHRQRIRTQRRQAGELESAYIRGDESDAFIDDDQQETFRSRRKALRAALELAMTELDQKYTLLQNLIDVFEEWRCAYPEEYERCFSSHSLADTASVLVKVELCSLNDPWNESQGYNEARWTAIISSALHKKTMDETSVERLFSKCVLPTILDLLDHHGVNLVSRRQMESLKFFIAHTFEKLLPANGSTWRQLRRRLCSYTAESLADICVAIVTQKCLSHSSEDIREAIYSLTWGQLYRTKKVLCNVLTFFTPALSLDSEFTELVLHFIGNKFMSLLSSLQGAALPSPLAESPSDVFMAVHQCLASTGWMEDPEYMIHTAPIRAALVAFGGNPPS